MGLVLSARQAAAGLRRISAGKEAEVVKILKLATAPLAKDARKAIKRTRVGRSIWGTKRQRQGSRFRTPPLLIRKIRTSFSRSRRQYVAGLRLKGFVRMIELGGVARAHPIAARQRTLLKFKGQSGAPTYKRAVKHPGSRFTAQNVIDPLVKKAGANASRQIDLGLGTFATRILRKVRAFA